MITRGIGGLILIILPLIAIFAAMSTKSSERRKLQEGLLVLTIVMGIAFSSAYVKITQIGTMLNETSSSNVFENIFQMFFGNFLFPITYFLVVGLTYFAITRYRDSGERRIR